MRFASSAPTRRDMGLVDKPGAPLDLTIDAVGNEWIELSWQTPIKDGGSPITGYIVERRTAANYKWHVSSMPSAVLRDSLHSNIRAFQAPSEPIEERTTKIRSLHTGHKYEFRVRAQNLAGLSEPSNTTKETEIRAPIIGEKPKFLQELETTTVVSGRTVTLTARARGDPTPVFIW